MNLKQMLNYEKKDNLVLMVCINLYIYFHILNSNNVGFRNLLLSDDFSLMKPWCSHYVYQDMTRYIHKQIILKYDHFYFLDH